MGDDISPPVSASLCSHDTCSVHHSGYTKVCNLDSASLVHQQVGSFEVPVHNLALVQVVHTSAHLSTNFENRAQLELTTLQMYEAAQCHMLRR